MNYLSNNYKGFYNLGNTCYLNSGLQLIINNKELCTKILNLTNENYDENTSSILRQLKDFITTYYNKNSTEILDPTFIKQLVANKNNEFTGYKQSDSFELIIYFLDFIFDILKVNKVYELTTNIKIKCKLLACLSISEHDEKNNYLILDILHNYKDLDDCYRNYKQREKLMDNNSYYCEKCQDQRIASKRTEITEWPNHLIVVLKRFSNEGRQRKNNNEIVVPISWRHGYELTGIVYHSGSLFGGHYIYIGKHNNKWIMFNDDHTSEVLISNLDNYKNFGYVYYFQKIN
jgi:ubiquitin C-terminal hydrolase